MRKPSFKFLDLKHDLRLQGRKIVFLSKGVVQMVFKRLHPPSVLKAFIPSS